MKFGKVSLFSLTASGGRKVSILHLFETVGCFETSPQG
jgi:hypothetical protein